MWQAKCRALKGGANHHDGCTDEDCLSSTEHVAHPDASNGAKETADIVGCDRDALDGGSVICLALSQALQAFFAGIDLWKDRRELNVCEQTSHHPLIITEEQEIRASNDSNGDL